MRGAQANHRAASGTNADRQFVTGWPAQTQGDSDAVSSAWAGASAAFNGVLSLAGSALGSGLSLAAGRLQGAALGPRPLPKAGLCCCLSDSAEGGKRFEVNDSANVRSIFSEDALASSVFPTILKQKEAGSKAPTPAGTPTAQSPTARRCFSGVSMGSPKSSPGGWVPGGFLASLMNSDAGQQLDLREWPEVELAGGDRYRGQWLGDERHGRGVLVGQLGGRYEGQFQHSMAHGRGVFTEASGSKYDGHWRQDRKHGHGTYVHADLTLYDGQWLEDVKSGHGTERWADGAEYAGEFQHGHKHGAGIYRAHGVEYEGQFKDDMMDGEGCYRFGGGRKYFGQWVCGHMHGFGRMELPNDASYEGSYENDAKHGEGIFVWGDGRRFAGQWQRGKQHGEGVSYDSAGNATKDLWSEGVLVFSEPVDPEPCP